MSPFIEFWLMGASAFGTAIFAGVIAHMIRLGANSGGAFLYPRRRALLWYLWRLFTGVKVGMWLLGSAVLILGGLKMILT